MDVDDLYGLPLDRFVTERTALSRALRADGQREQAAGVAARPKPSVAAWAVNQLVRTQKRAMTSLLRAGDSLRQAQDDVLAGQGDGRALRAAAESERGAVDVLVRTATGLLSADGHPLSPTILERVAETLHAAALDDDARAQVTPGCLQRELRHAGFGVGAGLVSAPRPRRTAPRRKTQGGAAETERARAHEREQAERERAEHERSQARTAARAAASEARRRVDRADRALALAQERRDQAEQALAEADETLDTARAEAQAAAQAYARAEEDLNELGK